VQPAKEIKTTTEQPKHDNETSIEHPVTVNETAESLNQSIPVSQNQTQPINGTVADSPQGDSTSETSGGVCFLKVMTIGLVLSFVIITVFFYFRYKREQRKKAIDLHNIVIVDHSAQIDEESQELHQDLI